MAKCYRSFAAYIGDVFYDEIHDKLKSYIYQNKGSLNLSSYNISDPSYTALDDFHVMSVVFHESENDRIRIFAGESPRSCTAAASSDFFLLSVLEVFFSDSCRDVAGIGDEEAALASG